VFHRFLRFFVLRFLRRGRTETDLNDEIQAHLALDAQARMEQGESPQSARESALRGFGNPGVVTEVTRDMWGLTWLEQLLRDLGFAFRGLRKAPLFTAVVVAALALGIGSTTAIFTVVHGILLRPLPFPDSNRLVMIWEIPPGTQKPNVVELKNFFAWKARSQSFQSMAAFVSVPMNLIGSAGNEQVDGLKVTADFFNVLGARPLLGRVFRPREYDRSAPREVVLSYGAWQRLFGGRSDVIGQRISIDVSHHEIVGIMPPDFGTPSMPAELYVPLANSGLRQGRNFSVISRLRSGVTLGAARAEMASIAARTATEDPELNSGWSATVVPLLDQTVGAIRPVLLVLFAAVALVLLIACANVANLLLMRSVRRTREISVRLALGAGTHRIMRQLLVESLLLSSLGGLLGLGLALAAVRLIITHLPPSLSIPRLHEITVDTPVLVFALCITLVSGIFFGLFPALQGLKPDLVRDLHESSRTSTSGGGLRAGFVVSEVALAVVLVVAATLMMRSFIRLIHVDPGFHTEHVLTTSMLLLPVQREEFHAQLVDQILERVRALPGVVAAGSIGILPMKGTNSGTWYYPAEGPDPPLNRRPGGDVSVITPGYFRALGVRILRGRDFNDHDRPGAQAVGILNETAARVLFPHQNPVGQSLRVWWNNLPNIRIVGIASDIRHSQLNAPPDPCLFLPNDQAPFPFSSLVVRTSGDPMKLAPAIRHQIHEVDDDQGIAKIESMQQIVADSVARPRIEAMLLTAFGLIALLLACIGIYGVLAYAVTQRTREIGIRVALGAARHSIFKMILRDGFRLTVIGLAIGLSGAAVLSRFLCALLFEIKPDDPLTLAGVIGLLGAVGLLACYVPAARAMRVDPAIVLREE